MDTVNGIELSPDGPDFENQMALAKGIMRADKDVLLLSALPPLKTFIFTVTWHHG